MAQVVMAVNNSADQARSLEKHIRTEMALGTIYARSGEEALRHIASGKSPIPDVVILDMGVRTATLDTIRALHSFRSDMQIIALVSHVRVDMAMEALACGASDFLLMPFHAAQLTAAIRNALLRRELQLAARCAHDAGKFRLEEIEAKSAGLNGLLYAARKLAASEGTLVLEGAPGVGREFFARAIHHSSARAQAPFLSCNCALYSEMALEERLFGSASEEGLLHKVGEGSLLLRNVDTLSAALRQRLAVLDDKKTPIHAARPAVAFRGRIAFVTSDAASHASASGRRESHQLFSRLGALSLRVPYLREMAEDIPFFATLLCRHYAAMEGRPVLGLSAEVKRLLQEISWPGNMEQLSQAVFHAVMCSNRHELQVEDFRYLYRPSHQKVMPLATLPEHEQPPMPAKPAPASGKLQCIDEQGNVKRLQDIEQEMIRYALERYSGHMSEIARQLGIGRSTLYRKISSMDGR